MYQPDDLQRVAQSSAVILVHTYAGYTINGRGM